MPVSWPNQRSDVLDPRNTWEYPENYNDRANNLAWLFVQNFEQHAQFSGLEINNAAP
ncbi:MAG: hypothetical protein ACXVAY_02480 [Mucilaginibacter sp.]